MVGFVSGIVLLASPSGEGMGLQDLRDDLPVADFTLVGLFFVTSYGVLPSVAAYGLWTKKRWRWTDPFNRWTGQHWAWTASAALGIIMLVWIAAETYFLGVLTGIGGALQAIISLLGLAILALVLLPSVRDGMRLEPLPAQ